MLLFLAVIFASISIGCPFCLQPKFPFDSRYTSACSNRQIYSAQSLLNTVDFTEKSQRFTMNGNGRRSPARVDLKSLPRVFPAPEIWARALKRASYVKEDIAIKNPRNRCRKLAAERLSVLSKELTKPLGACLDGFNSVLGRLAPFERVVVDLTVRHRYSHACHVDVRQC